MANGKKLIYISGKITGDDNYRTKFAMAENRLIRDGYNVVNPVERADRLDLVHKYAGLEPPTWREYIRKCIVAIIDVGAVYMLRDWQESRGARLEHYIASELGIEIVYEEEATEDRASCDNSSIIKLHYLLKSNGIPHTLIDRAGRGWQILYPDTKAFIPTDDTVASVIQGGDSDLLGIIGLLTPEENHRGVVARDLPVADVFGRIQAHWAASRDGRA